MLAFFGIIFLIFLFIMLLIGVLIVLAMILALGLIIGIVVAYVKAAIIYIASIVENVDNLAARIVMIAFTSIVVGGPLLVMLIGIISSL